MSQTRRHSCVSLTLLSFAGLLLCPLMTACGGKSAPAEKLPATLVATNPEGLWSGTIQYDTATPDGGVPEAFQGSGVLALNTTTKKDTLVFFATGAAGGVIIGQLSKL